MACKKCGYATLMEDGDWLECPNCGAKYFNTEIKTEISATRQIDMLEKQKSSVSKINDEEKSDENSIDSSTVNSSEEKEEKEPSKLKSTIDFLLPIIIAVIIALLLKTFVFANAIVPTGSMTSTINAKDRIIASRLAYIKNDPQRYDIIIFKFPDDESTAYVKRIIGLPGETVSISNGVAYITDKNGQSYQTEQSFLSYDTPRGDFGPYYIPEKGEAITKDENGYCFAENGMEVGTEGFVEKYCEKDKDGNFVKDENGNYIMAENCYFCLGDNRNNSADSRYWQYKYVAKSKIIGQAKFRYYPKISTLQ